MPNIFNNSITAVIFDMDGLVLDTEPTFLHAWRIAAEEMGHALSEQQAALWVGLERPDFCSALQRYFGSEFDIETFFYLSSKAWHENTRTDGIGVKTGFFSLLQVIRANRWSFCLATNSPADLAQQCLRMAGLTEVFNEVVSAESLAQGKPSPEIYRHAAARLDQPLQTCLILEDSITGIRAAAQTPATSVYIPSTAAPVADAVILADRTYRDMAELAACLLA